MIDDYSNFMFLIVKMFNHEYFDFYEMVTIHDATLFQPSTIIGTITMVNFKRCGNIFSKHGGSQFSGWWFDKNMQNVPIQVDDLPNNISYNYTYTSEYFFLDDADMGIIHKYFLQMLGYHIHVQCEKHRLPLIESTTHKKCECEKKEFLRCCKFYVEISCEKGA